LHVRDLGSRNGTFINGWQAEGNAAGQAPNPLPDTTVGLAKDGDVLTVGGTSLKVDIKDCPVASQVPTHGNSDWPKNEAVKTGCPSSC
jgi:pSer/pThr/pTyr-binding forkhead associated (FHA) protein